ncbi:hypothetical protein BD779DRAFT_1479265 [Infundibulicybe gibba]|nr:hypothetical protein BD779DRAFT_1479265 [Infundibulicybe gibba]
MPAIYALPVKLISCSLFIMGVRLVGSSMLHRTPPKVASTMLRSMMGHDDAQQLVMRNTEKIPAGAIQWATTPEKVGDDSLPAIIHIPFPRKREFGMVVLVLPPPHHSAGGLEAISSNAKLTHGPPLPPSQLRSPHQFVCTMILRDYMGNANRGLHTGHTRKRTHKGTGGYKPRALLGEDPIPVDSKCIS